MLVLTEKWLQSSHYKYVQRTKGTIIKEVKEAMMTSLHQTENINKDKKLQETWKF